MSKKTIVVDSVTYHRESCCGDKTLVVLDNGFIFVGLLSGEKEELKLTSCFNVRKWSSGGIGGLSMGCSASQAVLDEHADIKFSRARVVYTTLLKEDW